MWKEKGHVSLLKGKLSEVERGTYRIWKVVLTSYERSTYENEKGATIINENVH